MIHYLLQAIYADVVLLFKREVSKYLLWDILYCDSLQRKLAQIPDRSICLLFNSDFFWTKGGGRHGQWIGADAAQPWWVGRAAMQPDSFHHGQLGCAWSTKQSWWSRLWSFSEFLCLFLSKHICGCCQETFLLGWHLAKLRNVIWIWTTVSFLLKWNVCFKMSCWNRVPVNKLFSEKFVY